MGQGSLTLADYQGSALISGKPHTIVTKIRIVTTRATNDTLKRTLSACLLVKKPALTGRQSAGRAEERTSVCAHCTG